MAENRFLLDSPDAQLPRLVAARRSFLYGLGAAVVSGCGARSGAFPSVLSPRNPECNILQSVARRPEGSREILCGGGDLSGLSIAQIQALTTDQIYGLTGAQIGTLTPIQTPALTSPQVGAFHGSQASAILAGAIRMQGGATPAPLSYYNPQPATYTPAVPGSAFWSWFGGMVGGVVGGFLAVPAGPVGVFFGSQLLGVVGGLLGGQPVPAYFNFWNPNAAGGMGAWNGVAITFTPGTSNLDSDGYFLSGDFDPGSNTVTITILEN